MLFFRKHLINIRAWSKGMMLYKKHTDFLKHLPKADYKLIMREIRIISGEKKYKKWDIAGLYVYALNQITITKKPLNLYQVRYVVKLTIQAAKESNRHLISLMNESISELNNQILLQFTP